MVPEGQAQGGSGRRSSRRPPGRQSLETYVVGHLRIDRHPVGAGQLARLGGVGAEQLGHPGVPLDGRALGAGLGGDAGHVHRLVGEDVHREDLVGAGVRLRGVQVRPQVVARSLLDERLVLGDPVDAVLHEAELPARVDERLTGRLAVHGHLGADQLGRGRRELALLETTLHTRPADQQRRDEQEGQRDGGEPVLAAEGSPCGAGPSGTPARGHRRAGSGQARPARRPLLARRTLSPRSAGRPSTC